MNEIIYLEPDDDITKVISRIKETEANLVALVIPRGGTLAQSTINLKILKREVEGLKKEISLVSSDKISKNLASQVGITVYGSANEAKLARPIAVKPATPFVADDSLPVDGSSALPEQDGIKVNRYNREDDAAVEGPLVEDKITESQANFQKEVPTVSQPEHTSKKRELRPIPRVQETNDKSMKPKKIGSKKKVLLVVGSIVLVATLVLAYVFVPSATATIILETTDLETTNEIVVDKNVNKEDNETFTIPGVIVEVEKDLVKEYNASGVKDVGEKTTAEITFYNDYDINPQIIAAGTTVTAKGLNYTLDETISIPGANVVSLIPLQTTPGSISGKITASSPGAEYNIEAANFLITSFSGSKKEKIYGQSASTLAGGTSKKVTVISEDDMNNAKASVQVELEEAAKASILEEAGEDSKLITSTFRSEEQSFNASKNVDEEAATFTLTKKILSTAMTFSEEQLREMIMVKNEADLGGGKTIINSEDTEIPYEVVSYDEENGKVSLSVKFVGKVGNKIEEDVVKNQITNKKFGEAVTIIKGIDGVEDLELDIWPTVLARTPFVKQRITIKFDYVQ